MKEINIVVLGADRETWSDTAGSKFYHVKHENDALCCRDTYYKCWDDPEYIEDSGIHSVREISPIEAWLESYDDYDKLSNSELKAAQKTLETASKKVNALIMKEAINETNDL